MSRAGEVKAVAARIDELLSQLNETVTALNAVLVPPPEPQPQGDST
jgi:hypothetical protein